MHFRSIYDGTSDKHRRSIVVASSKHGVYLAAIVLSKPMDRPTSSLPAPMNHPYTLGGSREEQGRNKGGSRAEHRATEYYPIE
ncbi:hypothetical protein [uncultured Algoriphagus sp.]|uniref:hypothetical protein n=1 Tax=uncultured Algoriphagus sp. TaxID=417365 RepID=UPI0030EE3720